MKQAFPILEYDKTKEALINPKKLNRPIANIPKHCVICFFNDIIKKLESEGLLTEIASQKSEIGAHPIFKFTYKGNEIALFHPGVGEPLAAGLLEEVIARGSKKFIACGGAGVLDSNIPPGHLIIPETAIRDEGTSYHYLPPAREVKASAAAVEAIKEVFTKSEIKYISTKTWTTDAMYRETPLKIAMRKEEGCLSVEMEAAALFAVAKFRNVKIGQILYSGDDISGEIWDSRDWDKRKDTRENVFWLAAEACLEIKD